MQTSNDSLLAVIQTGVLPQEMSISKKLGYLFVTCTEDLIGVPPHTKGSVTVINYNTNTFVSNIYGFYQPHGISVDETKQMVYVASRNVSADGSAPHHISNCGARNGFVQKIDINTLNLVNGYRMELSGDPYSVITK
jgi:DNA-binding beta-propeller fold protein YncE